ncbi:hypothetical protein BpHYR1_017947 [Brachionus plicatilis]|uniref:Uncharacterized protein n=1 Tax=Brachionus plicatilis TaxID=10195 RepID=A0A3M7P303_BRAPC|nr:hypothetical protein BpHYR1_017947 [Brachionus plicatilis]
MALSNSMDFFEDDSNFLLNTSKIHLHKKLLSNKNAFFGNVGLPLFLFYPMVTDLAFNGGLTSFNVI